MLVARADVRLWPGSSWMLSWMLLMPSMPSPGLFLLLRLRDKPLGAARARSLHPSQTMEGALG